MTDALPDPMTPSDADLRGFEFMPYHGAVLRDSDLNSRATDAEYRAAHNLWWSAWCQLPAGSLPDDDVALCKLADLGRDQSTWQQVKTVALRGFVRCSDGRLYHGFLSHLVCDAWAGRLKAIERGRRGASMRWAKNKDDAGTRSDEASNAATKKNDDKGQDRTGKEQQQRAESADLSTGATAPPGEEAAAAAELIYPNGISAAQQKTIGKRLNGNPDAQLLLDELAGAMQAGRVKDPIALLQRMIGQQAGGTFLPSHADRIQVEREAAQLHAEVEESRRPAENKVLTFDREHAPTGNWWSTVPGILEKGRQEGVAAVKGESINAFRLRLIAKIGDGPWSADLDEREKVAVENLRTGTHA